jgi:transposase
MSRRKRELTAGAVVRRYNFKLYPSKTQAQTLDHVRRLHCHFYNAALEERIGAYKAVAYAKREIVPAGTFIDRRGNERPAYRWRHLSSAEGVKGHTLTHFDQALSIKTIRAEDPAYAAISFDSLSGTLRRLDLAFNAFYARAKAGAGAASGFPRFQRSDDYPGFWHRDGKGWKLTMRPDAGRGSMTIKGVPGAIKFRGRFPIPPLKILTCDLRLDGGVWWASIAVEIPARMRAEEQDTGEVIFDLVDHFARVRRVNGGRAAGPDDTVFAAAEGRTSPHSKGLQQSPCGDPANAGEPRARPSGRAAPCPCGDPANAGEPRGTPGPADYCSACGDPANAGEPREPDQQHDVALACGDPANGGAPRVGPTKDRVGRIAGNVSRDNPLGEEKKRARNDPGAEWRESEIEELQRAMARCKLRSNRYRRIRQRKARLERTIACRRRESLHVWTTKLARQFGHLTIISPPLKEATKSARGTLASPGAAVAFKATVNRHVLSLAPGAAIEMLKYKLAERAGATEVIEHQEAPVMVANDIVTAAKSNRKLKRTIRHHASGTAGVHRHRETGAGRTVQ